VAALATARTLPVFAAAWLLAGAAMAAVLYPPAFAALTRYYEPDHVRALTTLTLVAGLASTVFAPLTDTLAAHLSWRGTYAVLAVVLAIVTVPLHALALRRPWPATGHRVRTAAAPSVVRGRAFLCLGAALTLASFAMFAVLTNLIPLLTARGASPSTAAWALGLGGIGQVSGRVGYATLARRTSVRARTVMILAASAATTAALAALPGPVPVLIAVAMLAGATRGITTLLQATAVTDRWGTASYGALSGILAAPIITATALAPVAGTTLAGALGGYPALFAALSVCAALAAVLAAGSVPRFPAGDSSSIVD
jgi:MFS family permease